MKKSFKAVLSLVFCVILVASTTIVAFAALGNVSNLKATNVTHNSATLTWTAATGADGYEVRPYTGGKYGTTVKVTTTTYKATLTPGSSYYFYVRSYDKGILKTTYGNWVKVAVSAKPATVTNFKATAVSGTSVKLTWTKVSGATGYVIQQYKNKKYTNIKVTTGNYYTVTGLTAGSTYYFRVAAYVKYNGKNIYGAYSLIKTTATYAAPTSLKVTKTATTGATLSWGASSGAQKYQIYNYTTKKYSYSSKNYVTLSGLEASTKYQVKVRGYSKVNGKTIYGTWTSYLAFTTLPEKVTNLTASNLTQTSVSITFDKATAALGYQVFLYDYTTKTETKLIKQLTTNTYDITGLNPGSTYRIGVCSYIKNGSYFYSAKSYVYIDTAPEVTAGAETTETDIQLSWNEVRKAKVYKIERYEAKEYSWTTLTDLVVETPYTGTVPSENKVTYLDSGVGENTAVLYRITAYLEDGETVINTVEAEVSTLGLEMVKNDFSVTVTWDIPDSTTKYTVYKMPLQGYQNYNLYVHDFEITDPTTDSYTFSLAPNEVHNYMIYASRDGAAGVAVANFTVKMGKLVINSSDESKNAQLLMLVNAINKAKLEKDETTVIADSYAKMVLDAIYMSEDMLDEIPGASLLFKNGQIAGDDLVSFFKLLVAMGAADESDIPETVTIEDPDPVTYTFSEGYATTSSGSKIALRNVIEPSGTSNKLAYLYDQHNPSNWDKGFTAVTTTYYPSTGKYKVVATLKQETFGTSTTQSDAYYHPGFISVYDALGFSGEGVDNEKTSLGATKITAYIDAEGRIYNYSITSPFSTKFMASNGSDAGIGMMMTGTTTLSYKITY